MKLHKKKFAKWAEGSEQARGKVRGTNVKEKGRADFCNSVHRIKTIILSLSGSVSVELFFVLLFFLHPQFCLLVRLIVLILFSLHFLLQVFFRSRRQIYPNLDQVGAKNVVKYFPVNCRKLLIFINELRRLNFFVFFFLLMLLIFSYSFFRYLS